MLNAGDVDKALQLSGREFKGSSLKIELSKVKPQSETSGKSQETSRKPGKGGNMNKGAKENSDIGQLMLIIRY